MMIERIARALEPRVWDRTGPAFEMMQQKSLDKARAALTAMLDATPGMIEAADSVSVHGADLHDFVAYDCAPVIWQAMIQAALGEQP